MNVPVADAIPSLITRLASCLAPKSLVAVMLRSGQTVEGSLGFTMSVPWVHCKDGTTLVLSREWGNDDLDGIGGLRVLREGTEVLAEQNNRKYGVENYSTPATAHEFETTLYNLAADRTDHIKGKRQNFDRKHFLRQQQIEAQFDRVADLIRLAKAKRRYILHMGARWREGKPLLRAKELAATPLDESLYAVPKPQDFDPDPTVRAKQWPRPALDYDTRAELEASLKAARNVMARRGRSAKKRAQMERIINLRVRQIERGDYFEAVRAREEAIIHPV